MLAELQLILDQERIDYKQLSSLQGVLMEQISPEYAATLHQQKRNPYSQAFVKEDGKSIWSIRTMNKEAYQQLIEPLRNNEFQQFHIKHSDLEVRILEKKLKTVWKKELFREFYKENATGHFEMEFLTPTAFKSNGRYQCYPSPHFIYQSLMQKFSAVSEEMDLWDEEALEELEKRTEIVKYKLMTFPFPLEGVWITGFKGQLAFRLVGADAMKRYARLLFRFGEYSGIGIKTAIGMGAFRFEERKGQRNGNREAKDRG